MELEIKGTGKVLGTFKQCRRDIRIMNKNEVGYIAQI